MRILFLTLAIASLLILPSLTNAQKYANDDSLILYMPFNEVGNHGKLEGGPQWVAGKHGKAIEFDGDDDVVIIETKNSKELQLHESAGTAECWFLMKGEGISTAPRLIAKESITNDSCDCDPLRGGFALKFRKHGVKLTLQLSVEQGSRKNNDPNPEAEVNNDVWYHAAGTWEEGEHRVYLNGKLVFEDKGNEALPLKDVDNDLRIGGSFAGFRNFHGIIDEVRIWNRALPVVEIKDNMNLGFGPLLGVSPDGMLTTTWGQIKARFE
ncbi:LamG domain-containing protein [Candidatus Poribacteria bacterium]|nr:LamG domain-containing protein [Candidatus Poribacteria bacterium]